MKPVAEMEHFRSVNSGHFSPGGEWMVSVAQDNKLRLYRDLALASGKVRKASVLLLLQTMSAASSALTICQRARYEVLYVRVETGLQLA